jgi:hypothetical protein
VRVVERRGDLIRGCARAEGIAPLGWLVDEHGGLERIAASVSERSVTRGCTVVRNSAGCEGGVAVDGVEGKERRVTGRPGRCCHSEERC